MDAAGAFFCAAFLAGDFEDGELFAVPDAGDDAASSLAVSSLTGSKLAGDVFFAGLAFLPPFLAAGLAFFAGVFLAGAFLALVGDLALPGDAGAPDALSLFTGDFGGD